ncbi:MAG: glucose-1-phosphate thymidylyltransferase [Actinobacteria bacterium]|nr:glucose-1-phosphate thymidylyltransferase [Actinomycetota bacterium]
MKGLILSGGAGTRLRPITHTSAKQLVPVANKPILFYGIEDMVAAGITDIGIITGETGPEVMEAVGDGSRFGAQITYIAQDEPLGLAQDFVMYLGDNMLQQGLIEFVHTFELDRALAVEPTLHDDHVAPSAQILLAEVPDPHRFGIAAVNERGHVVQLVEKPEDPPSNLALVGVYLFTPAIHEAVASIEPSARGELEITDAIQWLIDQGHRVRHDSLTGWWLDTGKKDPLLESNRRVLETLEARIDGEVDDSSDVDGRVVIEAGAEIRNSRIRGPVIIGPGSVVVDSYIGPYTAIGSGCRIERADVDQSVVLDRSSIVGVTRLSDSLIGRDAEVHRSRIRPAATRLMIGDHSSVDLE